MSLEITKICPATEQEWDRAWKHCEYATFFHSLKWARIWEEYTKGRIRPAAKKVIFSDGNTAILPLSCRKRFRSLLKQYISSPAGTFGGWISADPLNDEHKRLLFNWFDQLSDIQYRINPYESYQYNLAPKDAKPDHTRVLSLNGDIDTIYKKWYRGHRSAVKKAIREGVTVRQAESITDWKNYFQIYEDSIRRWGKNASSRYRWDLFQIIHDLNEGSACLWLGEYNNTLICGALCLDGPYHVAYWHGAALEKYFKLRGVNLLFYEAIRHSIDKGYTWFDFNPSGEHKGVDTFKKKFNATALSAPVINKRSKTKHNLLRVADKIARLVQKE